MTLHGAGPTASRAIHVPEGLQIDGRLDEPIYREVVIAPQTGPATSPTLVI